MLIFLFGQKYEVRSSDLKRRKKKTREDFGGPPKKQKGKNLTLLDGERDGL
jgi:hypothetical protein